MRAIVLKDIMRNIQVWCLLVANMVICIVMNGGKYLVIIKLMEFGTEMNIFVSTHCNPQS